MADGKVSASLATTIDDDTDDAHTPTRRSKQIKVTHTIPFEPFAKVGGRGANPGANLVMADMLKFFASTGICFAISPPKNTDSRLVHSICTFTHSSSVSAVSDSIVKNFCTTARK